MGAVKAWIVRQLGGPEVLTFEAFDPPPPRRGLVRIAVEASAVNFFDSLQIAGSYQVKPELPFVPGTEVAGTVVTAPADSGFNAGDRVLARLRQEGPRRAAAFTWDGAAQTLWRAYAGLHSPVM